MATSEDLAAYLRVASYALLIFDYLQTFPAEIRLYTRQKGIFDLSPACILFILVRYVGIATLIVGNQGYFYHGFTVQSCHHYYWATPILKLMLYAISQTILAMRTYAVSRRSVAVKYMLMALFTLVFVIEAVGTFYKRIPFMNAGNCTSGSPAGIPMASLYYAGGLVFDVVTMIVTFSYLFKYSTSGNNGVSMIVLARIMFEDGISYFFALTAMNVVNIIFFQSPDSVLQSSAGGLGIAATTIFSGHFILNLSEHGRDMASQSHSSRMPNRILQGAETTPTAIYVTRNVEITMDDLGSKRESETTSAKDAWRETDIA